MLAGKGADRPGDSGALSGLEAWTLEAWSGRGSTADRRADASGLGRAQRG
jgi:hypothetical protein